MVLAEPAELSLHVERIFVPPLSFSGGGQNSLRGGGKNPPPESLRGGIFWLSPPELLRGGLLNLQNAARLKDFTLIQGGGGRRKIATESFF